MFEIFESPIYYRRVPSFYEVARRVQMRNMLDDLLFNNYDIPQMYLYFRSNILKQNKKNKDGKHTKKEVEKTEQKEEVEKPELKKETEKEVPEVPQQKMENNDLYDLHHMQLPNFDDESEDEFGVPKEMAEEFWKPVKVEDLKNRELPVEIPFELPKKENDHSSDSEDEYEEEEIEEKEEHNEEPEPFNEIRKFDVDEKKNEVEEEKPEEIAPEQEDEDFTCETRTITKKGGFKHIIRTERSEETGIVIVTETREIGNQSMTLKKVIYTDGDIEEFESRKSINDDELEDFKAKWIKAFPQE